MTKTKETANPGLQLRALYCTAAGRKIVKVEVEAGRVSVGNETWKVDPRAHSLPGRGKFDIILIQGQSEALSIWKDSPVSPEEYNATAHNNYLEQVHALTESGKTSAVSWVQLGVLGLLFIAVIGVGVKLNGDFSDVQKSIDRLAKATCGPAGCTQDTVHDPSPSTPTTPPQDLGHLQQQGANPA